ncbi:hypothetical protein DPMN_070161 [Dreissena polymorpha]|uniref:Uncharacterized protein n=1 Tax=Dreissena polymorpha TaxID=45954 RepID=A0A9D3Z0G8_DREPO|nr:hypothetical protein DPMN_070161 [Dreissena polymorpha]
MSYCHRLKSTLEDEKEERGMYDDQNHGYCYKRRELRHAKHINLDSMEITRKRIGR